MLAQLTSAGRRMLLLFVCTAWLVLYYVRKQARVSPGHAMRAAARPPRPPLPNTEIDPLHHNITA